MVVDTTYYDILQVEPTADEAELRKAYRKQAIKLHPDKNGNDPRAAEKFQDLGEAYGVLSNPDSRKIYDQYGVEGMKNHAEQAAANIDPSEFFETVFGGVAFRDWIGKLGLMDDLTKSAEVLNLDEEEEEEEQEKEKERERERQHQQATSAGHHHHQHHNSHGFFNHSSNDDFKETSNSNGSLSSNFDSLTLADSTKGNSNSLHARKESTISSQDLKKKRKQKMTKEQREEILRIHEEGRQAKLKRIEELSQNLIIRIDDYRAASTNPEGLKHFTRKLREEFDDMKVESFGIQLLHLIGKIYTNQAKATIQASKTFGVSKLYTSVKSSSETVKNGYSIIKTALDAQETMEKVMVEQETFQSKLEHGYEPTQIEISQQAERERFVTGKFLATGWSLVKFEVTSVLNKVCQNVLHSKKLGKKERVARANALLYIGKEMLSIERSPEEDDDARIFEEMMADAKIKKDKKREGKHHLF